VQYLRYAQFLRISRTAKYAAFFEIAQALILNFLRRHLKSDFLRVHQVLSYKLQGKANSLAFITYLLS
ncbi:MAG: hypothetical protein K9K62_08490, partial [Desulfobacteraceae bacterium]|nr:hypothetical protein [Desulfobacteraceae bacterium]